MTHSLLIIDMQLASVEGPAPIANATSLVKRINTLAARVRQASGRVIFVQFQGPVGSPYHPDLPGWQLLPDLEVEPDDLFLQKPGSDAFLDTDLEDLLGSPSENNIIITGCVTEFCIDSTLRSALAKKYATTVPEDGHACPDRSHLRAEQIIRHHNAIWSTVGALAGPVTVCKCSEVRLSAKV